MNWKQIVTDLFEELTLQQIADACGLASKGHVHDIKTGKQSQVYYDAGVKLLALHKKVMRRKSAAKK
jgi:hypothetical protein